MHPLLILIFPTSSFLKLKKPSAVLSAFSVFLKLKEIMNLGTPLPYLTENPILQISWQEKKTCLGIKKKKCNI